MPAPIRRGPQRAAARTASMTATTGWLASMMVAPAARYRITGTGQRPSRRLRPSRSVAAPASRVPDAFCVPAGLHGDRRRDPAPRLPGRVAGVRCPPMVGARSTSSVRRGVTSDPPDLRVDRSGGSTTSNVCLSRQKLRSSASQASSPIRWSSRTIVDLSVPERPATQHSAMTRVNQAGRRGDGSAPHRPALRSRAIRSRPCRFDP